jgi:hypothetical protein
MHGELEKRPGKKKSVSPRRRKKGKREKGKGEKQQMKINI